MRRALRQREKYKVHTRGIIVVMIPKETLSLLRRLQSGVGRWPVNSSRKGRDLGEFLRTSYEQKFKNLIKTDVRFSR